MTKKRFNVELSDNLDRMVGDIARHEGVAKADVIRRALSGYAVLKERSIQGGRIYLRDADGQEREVILT